MKALAVITGVLLVATAAHAEDDVPWLKRQSSAVHKAYDDHGCMAKAVANPDMARCGYVVIDQLDAVLNRTWVRVLPMFSDDKTTADLRDEQRAWVTYKDKSCRFWASGEFGRMGQVLDYQGCRARVIAARIHELEELEKEMKARRDG